MNLLSRLAEGLKALEEGRKEIEKLTEEDPELLTSLDLSQIFDFDDPETEKSNLEEVRDK